VRALRGKVKPSMPSSAEAVGATTTARSCREDSRCDLKYVVHLDDWAIALIKLGYQLTKVELPAKK
jgi:hypothetical protein